MATPRRVDRPLAPHLQVYRFTITMMMSIMHRITGAVLYIGTIFLAWWLIAIASGIEAYELFQSVSGSWIGLLILFGFTWVLLHHLISGIRYFFWDIGAAFDPKVADCISWIALVCGLVLAIFVWIAAYTLREIL
jgi:succinate dehydrogenase / fumarate reductase cytochrome b subunit